MEELQIDHGGLMASEELLKYGKFNWLQKVKLGGTGSEKLIYVSGIKAFDNLANFNQDDNYCSFEIFPNGFICRYQAAIQRQAAVGILYKEIKDLILSITSDTFFIITEYDKIQFRIQNKHKSTVGFFKKLKDQIR